MKTIGVITFMVFMAVCGTLWQSWIFSNCINWFLTDLQFPLWQQKYCAAGLLFIRFATHQYIDTDDSQKSQAERMGAVFGITFLFPAFMWLFAAGIHRFM